MSRSSPESKRWSGRTGGSPDRRIRSLERQPIDHKLLEESSENRPFGRATSLACYLRLSWPKFPRAPLSLHGLGPGSIQTDGLEVHCENGSNHECSGKTHAGSA